MTMQKNI